MAVRTKLLAEGATPNVFTTIYTCPAGETAILKNIHCFNPAGGATELVEIQFNASGTNRVLERASMPVQTIFAFDTWIVIPAGATMRIRSTPNGGVNYWFSGTELEGVAD